MSELVSALLAALVSFLVAWLTVRSEESKGRAALYSLCCRYFISVYNSIDHSTEKWKGDSLSKQQHVAELSAIVQELSSLSQNPLFAKFVARNAYASKMLVQLRREHTEHQFSDPFALNRGSIVDLAKTFEWCIKLPWGFWLAKQSEHTDLVRYVRKCAGGG
jgi:hypothetical protein